MKPSLFCRGDRIRTCGRLVPNQERYRAALHPEYASFRICVCKGNAFSENLQILSYYFIIPCSTNIFFSI